MRLITLFCTFGVLFLACSDTKSQPTPTTSEPTSTTKVSETIRPETYEIMTTDQGTLTTIGIIAFDEENNSELTLLTDAAAATLLKDRWEVISGYPEIDFESGGARQQEDGSCVNFTEFLKVGKDNPDYPIAAMQFLQLHHGYRFVLRPGGHH